MEGNVRRTTATGTGDTVTIIQKHTIAHNVMIGKCFNKILTMVPAYAHRSMLHQPGTTQNEGARTYPYQGNTLCCGTL
ncbi:hypothetical protein AA0482_0856 [Acetobacter cibinongensis NRIC 0482]|nr:hypothetical protein AA0482_0856 [Acetobacter cibinongensis NRIC 0482]